MRIAAMHGIDNFNTWVCQMDPCSRLGMACVCCYASLSVQPICSDLGQVDSDPRHHAAAGADLKRSTSIHAHNAKGRPSLKMGDNYSFARCTLQLHVAFFRISWQILPSKGFLIGPTHCRLNGKEISLQQFVQEYLEEEAVQPG